MREYQKQGCVRKGTALLLSACFLLGSSMTAFAAGDGLADAYEGMTVETIDRTSFGSDEDAEAVEMLCRAYDLDPDSVVMMDEGMELYGSRINITWLVPAGKLYMSSGFRESVGNQVMIAVSGDPNDITYQTGLKDPTETLLYIEGEGMQVYTFDIELGGRYYFFVYNLSETEDLDVDATIYR